MTTKSNVNCFCVQVQDNFERIDFNRMCWTLCARKNLDRNNLLISDDDAFKVWCIFNFLSEDKYPLVIVSEEVGLTVLITSTLCVLLLSAVCITLYHDTVL